MRSLSRVIERRVSTNGRPNGIIQKDDVMFGSQRSTKGLTHVDVHRYDSPIPKGFPKVVYRLASALRHKYISVGSLQQLTFHGDISLLICAMHTMSNFCWFYVEAHKK